MGAIAAYLRVSSAGQTVRSQRSAIERAAAARGERVTLWVTERASARTLSRPELDRLRQLARGGEVSKVYVFALDRLVRSGILDAFTVVNELRHNGCRVSSISDPFDLDGPAGDVVLAVMAWGAQLELKKQQDRRAAARERVKAAGGSWGRPRRLSPTEVRKAQQLVSQGRSQRSIAVALKVKRSTLQGYLRPDEK
jgi:DNA invertase Pin-like site-specific DNA recombinase